jgi:hypothetical protein
MNALAQALNEYGAAIRGDWSQIDGRSVRDVLEQFASAVDGGPESEWSLDKWRNELGVCLDGGGHWGGRWGYCPDYKCPTYMAEESSS